MTETPRMTTILHEWFSVLLENAVLLAVATLLIIALSQICDMTGDSRLSTFMGVPVGVFGQYYLVETMLGRQGAGPRGGKRHFASLFVASLLGSLGVIAGFVLLIVPGLYLAARWIAATPFIVDQETGGIASLKASWAATSEMAWSIVLAMVIGFAPLALIALGAGIMVGLTGMEANHTITLLVNNIWSSCLIVLGWTLSVAVYRLIKPASGQLEAVFA